MPETKPAPTTETTRDPDKKEKFNVADVQKLNENPKFDVPVSKVRTAEDAYQAYLREEITEEELRAVVGANGGGTFYALKANLERPDNAFKRDVPEDLYDDPSIAVTTVDERLKAVEERDKEAEKAQKAADEADKELDKGLDPTVRGNIRNEAAAKEFEKTEKTEKTDKS